MSCGMFNFTSVIFILFAFGSSLFPFPCKDFLKHGFRDDNLAIQQPEHIHTSDCGKADDNR